MSTSSKSNGADRVRYAVVGLGNIAQTAILPAFDNADNSELVALVSGSAEKRDELARRYQVEHSIHYDDYDDLLEEGLVDAVFLTVPNHLHCDYTVRAARAGVHVLCEKPMAVTVDECRQMIQACADADVRLMVAYRLHFERVNLEVVELARSGELGALRVFDSVFTQSVEEGDIRLYPLDKGGGTVYDLGVYCINAARHLFGDEPTEVIASSVRPADDPRFTDCDEMTSAILRFPDDRLASFVTSFGADRVNQYRLVGTRGTLSVEPAYDYDTSLGYELAAGGRRRSAQLEPRDQFGPELLYFSSCVLENREPEPGGREGLIDVQVVQAIYESAASGQPVRILTEERRRRPDLDQEITRPPVQPPPEV